MNKSLQRLIEPGSRLYIGVLVLFAAASCFFGMYELAVLEAAAVLFLVVYTAFVRRNRTKKLEEYIESVTYETENAKSNTLMNFPLPIAVFRLDSYGIVWGNEKFFEMSGKNGQRLDARMTDTVPQFHGKWLLEGKNQFPGLLTVKDRKYRVHGNIIRSANDEMTNSFMGITYWVDVTEYDNIKLEYEATRPQTAVIILDNLEELIKNQTERIKNDLRDEIDEKLKSWAEENGAILKRFERDRYIAVMDTRTLNAMKERHFAILDSVHQVHSPGGINATVSIGVSEGAENLPEALQFASVAAELALSRGGDQAVVKDKLSFEFFGGRGSEVEKRTKVKSRVMANTLVELICDSSCVMVMGHRLADLDALGACTGICCLARKCGVKANIVIDPDNNASKSLLDMLRREESYRDVFLSPNDALFLADGHTLLIVVDTNRPEQVESHELLETIPKVAVIDHHRMAATYIGNAALSFLEPYASSACELVTELLQEVVEPGDIYRCEAEAILSGMFLDTKSFTIRTGERTFDAAAYLRAAGADTVAVKRLMQTDMDDTVARYRIMQNAQLYRGVAVAVEEAATKRFIAAQAADELLNISGVDASVVIAADGKNGIMMSARSMGSLNAQLIMEKLGGGGNKSIAACQIPQISVAEAKERLCRALDEYFAG